MKKKIVAFISCILSFSLLLSSVAFAADQDKKNDIYSNLDIVEVNGVRTVTTTDEYHKYTVVYDQVERTISFTEQDLRTGKSKTATTDIDTVTSLSGIPGNSTRAVTTEQDTDSGFAWIKTNGTPNDWHLERPALDGEDANRFYFECYENSSNRSYITIFKTAVTTLANNEATFRGEATPAKVVVFFAGVLTGFAIGTGGTLSGPAIAALIAAAELTGDAAAAAEIVANQCNVCMDAYFDVWNNTDNYHF